MKDYTIVTDATCDMNLDLLEEHHILVIPMEIAFDDGRTFLHYPDFRNLEAKAFYEELRKGHTTSSTQITPSTYLNFFTPLLEEGKDILYICFSSGLSNTYESSVLAVNQLKEQFPNQRIETIDSLCASGGEGVFAIQAALNKEAGMEMEENIIWLKGNRLRLSHYFTVDELSYLHRGGRVSMATAVVGNALNIKPILYVDEQGKLKMLTTAHGHKSSIKKLLTFTEESIEDANDQVIYISQADCMEDAETLKEMILEKIPCRDVVITTVGPVVGTHTGPSLLCVFSFGKERKHS